MKQSVADFEKLIKEWDFEKNTNISPYQLAAHSTKIVWWKCSKCGYSWSASPNNRNKQKGTNCPACSSRVIIPGRNDLQSLYPDIAKRWHPTLNDIRPNEVAAHSHKYAYWTCPKDQRHFFKTRIDHMVDASIECPVCANQSVITGVNDLATTNPELIAEWDFKKNTTISPYKITYGNQHKVWWKCKFGHSWEAVVASRATTMHTGCPICAKELRISFQEAILSYYLSKAFDVVNSQKFDWLGNKEIDIYLPKYKLGIEYDGHRWHKDFQRDYQKDILCQKHGLTLIRIREPNCPVYTTPAILIRPNYKPLSQLFIQSAIEEILHTIKIVYNITIEIKVNLNRDYYEILQRHITLEKQNSLLTTDIITEWDYDKNGALLPSMFSKGSDKKVWWICKNNHSWSSTISSRTGAQHCGCPYCAGQKCLTGYNDLQTLAPALLIDWDYNKNSLSPNQICAQSNKKYWWKCHTCGHEWLSSAADRFNGRGCIDCGRKKTAAAHNKKIINIETGIMYESINSAALILGINAASISNCCRGKTKTAGGYHWKFVN